VKKFFFFLSGGVAAWRRVFRPNTSPSRWGRLPSPLPRSTATTRPGLSGRGWRLSPLPSAGQVAEWRVDFEGDLCRFFLPPPCCHDSTGLPARDLLLVLFFHFCGAESGGGSDFSSVPSILTLMIGDFFFSPPFSTFGGDGRPGPPPDAFFFSLPPLTFPSPSLQFTGKRSSPYHVRCSFFLFFPPPPFPS